MLERVTSSMGFEGFRISTAGWLGGIDLAWQPLNSMVIMLALLYRHIEMMDGLNSL